MAAVLSVPAERIVVTSIVDGSVVVGFYITGSSAGNPAPIFSVVSRACMHEIWEHVNM